MGWNLDLNAEGSDEEMSPRTQAARTESLRVSKIALKKYEEAILETMTSLKTKGGLQESSSGMPKAIGVAATLVEVMGHMDSTMQSVKDILGDDEDEERVMKVAKTHIIARLVRKITDNPGDFKD